MVESFAWLVELEKSVADVTVDRRHDLRSASFATSVHIILATESVNLSVCFHCMRQLYNCNSSLLGSSCMYVSLVFVV